MRNRTGLYRFILSITPYEIHTHPSRQPGPGQKDLGRIVFALCGYPGSRLSATVFLSSFRQLVHHRVCCVRYTCYNRPGLTFYAVQIAISQRFATACLIPVFFDYFKGKSRYEGPRADFFIPCPYNICMPQTAGGRKLQ